MPNRPTDIIPRLWWDGRTGVARTDGVTVDLITAPPICAHLVEIDYAPTMRVSMIRESSHGWREMTADERTKADELLASMAVVAHKAVEA